MITVAGSFLLAFLGFLLLPGEQGLKEFAGALCLGFSGMVWGWKRRDV